MYKKNAALCCSYLRKKVTVLAVVVSVALSEPFHAFFYKNSFFITYFSLSCFCCCRELLRTSSSSCWHCNNPKSTSFRSVSTQQFFVIIIYAVTFKSKIVLRRVSYPFFTMSSMKRLVAKIIDQFSHEAIIEIYVLDEAGNPFELYSGMPSGLTSKFFEEVSMNMLIHSKV